MPRVESQDPIDELIPASDLEDPEPEEASEEPEEEPEEEPKDVGIVDQEEEYNWRSQMTQKMQDLSTQLEAMAKSKTPAPKKATPPAPLQPPRIKTRQEQRQERKSKRVRRFRLW